MEETAAVFDSPRAVVRKFFDAFNKHELGQRKGILSDKLRVEVSGGLSAQGKEAVGALQAWADAFEGAHADVTNIVVSGNTVVTESTFSGTHTGVLKAPGLDLPVSRRPVKLPKDHCWFVVQNGLIVSVDLRIDRLALREQITGQAA